MEINTGASISIINYDMYLKSSWKLWVSLVDSIMFHTYSGKVMKARGKIEGVFEHEDQRLKH